MPELKQNSNDNVMVKSYRVRKSAFLNGIVCILRKMEFFVITRKISNKMYKNYVAFRDKDSMTKILIYF